MNGALEELGRLLGLASGCPFLLAWGIKWPSPLLPSSPLWHPGGGTGMASFWLLYWSSSSNYPASVPFQHLHLHGIQHPGWGERWAASWEEELACMPEWSEQSRLWAAVAVVLREFADSMRVGHDVTGTLAWPEQHGVQGSWYVIQIEKISSPAARPPPLLPASLSDNCKVMPFLSEVGHESQGRVFSLLACCNYHWGQLRWQHNTCGVLC